MTKRILVVIATIILTSTLMVEPLSLERPIINSPSIAMVELFPSRKVLLERSVRAEVHEEILKENAEIERQRAESEIIKSDKKAQIINILVSFYTNSISDCGKTDGVSANGTNLPNVSRGGNTPNYVAAPSNIAFSTRLIVEGFGECTVVDRGDAIKYVWLDGIQYMKIDIFVKGATRQELLNKGVVKTTGHIIEVVK